MSNPQPQPPYKFYATLLDAYQWYLDSESDTAFEDFINRINRVPFVSEAAEKGTAFNNLVDLLLSGQGITPEAGKYKHDGFVFSQDVVEEFVKELQGGLSQVHVSAILPTRLGDVELYGYMDELLPGCVIVDIKTTGSYVFPKYLSNWQHKVYPYCMNVGAPAEWSFSYLITDFKEVHVETYHYQPERDLAGLRAMCENLIEFLEQYRSLITDKKVFGGENEIAVLQNSLF